MINAINITMCFVGMSAGALTFAKHLNGFNQGKTITVDAWLVCVGTLAWSVWLFKSVQFADDIRNCGVGAGVEAFGMALLLIFWLGSLLQVQKHCLKLKLQKRRQERQHAK